MNYGAFRHPLRFTNFFLQPSALLCRTHRGQSTFLMHTWTHEGENDDIVVDKVGLGKVSHAYLNLNYVFLWLTWLTQTTIIFWTF